VEPWGASWYGHLVEPRPSVPRGQRPASTRSSARAPARVELDRGRDALGRAGAPVQRIAALGGRTISRTSKRLETYMPLGETVATTAITVWAALG
jgi:hypothetical protein